MDFIGRIKKKSTSVQKEKKMAPENLLLEHRFQAKKKNQQSIKNLYRLYSQLHSTFSDLYMLLCA